MQFQVPQFIEVEDKLFAGLTFKQFLYIAGGGAGSYVLYILLPGFISLPLILGFGGLALSLAFLKVNDRPFIYAMQSWIKFQLGPKLYTWRREDTPVKKQEDLALPTAVPVSIDKVSRSKLKDLAWSLDIQEKVQK
ncbi:MAG TPA: PrgI family protein [Nitrososphaera sp.]|nr:PrgI family protein [Nitrososphaera sp.]